MTILFVLQEAAPFSSVGGIGGRMAHLIGVVEALRSLGHRVVFLANEPLPYSDAQGEDYRHLPRSRTRVPKIGSLLGHLRVVREIARAVREEKPDLVYVRWTANPVFGLLRRIFPDLKIVAECNSPRAMHLSAKGEATPLRRAVAAHYDRQYLRAASVVSAVSQDVKDFLVRRYPDYDADRILVNPNGVDTERFTARENGVREELGFESSAVVIGFAGYFSHWHGLDRLIRAFQALDREDVKLLICGKGAAETDAQLRRLAQEKRAKQIVFAGPVPFDRMPDYLSSCDILVSPHTETINGTMHGSPIKIFEYMSMGRAVVASRIGQIAEVIEDGRTGILCTPGSVEELYAALVGLVDDPEQRSRLGRAARAAVERSYSWRANVTRVLDALPAT